MKRSLKVANVAGLLGLMVLFFIAGCGGGKSLDNVVAPTDNNATGVTYTMPTLTDNLATAIGVADTTFVKTFQGNATISGSGATYVGDARCAICHADIYNSFVTTYHATAAKRKVLNGTFTATSGSCLQCHTVDGAEIPDWSAGGASPVRTLAKGAFGLTAFDYKTNAATLAQISAFATATLGGIQCENCHGPASLHVGGGDTNYIVGGYQATAVSTCDVCHDAPSHHSKSQEWRQSVHSVSISAAGATTAGKGCNSCHSADGFIDYIKNRLAADPSAVTYIGNSSFDGSTPAKTASHNVTCAACHDPHSLASDTADTAQLRISADKLCIQCHDGRQTAPGNAHGPHHNIQGRILAGEDGMSTNNKMYMASSTDPVIPFIINDAGVTTTTKVSTVTPVVGPAMGAATCVDCHMYTPTGGLPVHTMVVNPLACQKCHAGLNGAAIIGAKQTAFNAKIAPVQARLAKATAANTAAAFTGANRILYINASWNLALVTNDGSQGFHNPDYINLLIDNASTMLAQLGY